MRQVNVLLQHIRSRESVNLFVPGRTAPIRC